jgi:hypothetical protein
MSELRYTITEDENGPVLYFKYGLVEYRLYDRSMFRKEIDSFDNIHWVELDNCTTELHNVLWAFFDRLTEDDIPF